MQMNEVSKEDLYDDLIALDKELNRLEDRVLELEEQVRELRNE